MIIININNINININIIIISPLSSSFSRKAKQPSSGALLAFLCLPTFFSQQLHFPLLATS
jgi:hypothetical protein